MNTRLQYALEENKLPREEVCSMHTFIAPECIVYAHSYIADAQYKSWLLEAADL
jgi:hypothetical protein